MDSKLHYYEKYKDSEKGKYYQKLSKEELINHMFQEEIFRNEKIREEIKEARAEKAKVAKSIKEEIYKQIEKENPAMIEALTGLYTLFS